MKGNLGLITVLTPFFSKAAKFSNIFKNINNF